MLRLPDRGDYSLVGPAGAQDARGDPARAAASARTRRSRSSSRCSPRTCPAQAQAAALRAIGAEANERYAGVPRGPAAVPGGRAAQPDRLRRGLVAAGRRGRGPLWAMVGVGGDDLAAAGFDLARTPSFIVAGPARSGRSTVLLAVAGSLLAAAPGWWSPRRAPRRSARWTAAPA